MRRTNYGKKLKHFRKKAGLSQDAVAKMMKISCSQLVSNIERGACVLPEKYIPLMSELYGVSQRTFVELLLAQRKQDILKIIKVGA